MYCLALQNEKMVLPTIRYLLLNNSLRIYDQRRKKITYYYILIIGPLGDSVKSLLNLSIAQQPKFRSSSRDDSDLEL